MYVQYVHTYSIDAQILKGLLADRLMFRNVWKEGV